MPDVDEIADEFAKNDPEKGNEPAHGDEDDGKDVENGDPAPSEPSAEEKEEERRRIEFQRVLKENERLKKANQTLNRKVREAPKAPEPPEQPEPEEDPLNTREGWLSKIEETASARTQEALRPILEANLRSATRRFVSAHPEYATAAKKEELSGLISAAQSSGSLDEESLHAAMGQAWASANWQELQEAASRRDEAQRRVQAAAARAAGTPEGSQPDSDDYTQEELEAAASRGMTPARYRDAARRLDESTLHTN